MKVRGASSTHLMILGASAALALGSGSATAQTQPTSYTADWSSVDQHPAAPEWFQDGKLGIWFHWGAHTTPQFYSEWYPYYTFDKSNGGGVYQLCPHRRPGAPLELSRAVPRGRTAALLGLPP